MIRLSDEQEIVNKHKTFTHSRRKPRSWHNDDVIKGVIFIVMMGFIGQI